ncbi:MAG: type II toxin-antitoxin system PemK/MazF family toxin [Rickettsiales bacterium]
MKRGDIYFANLDPSIGSETKKRRPVVIVSNNLQNTYSDRVVILPITSQAKKVYPFEVLISNNGIEGKAMCDQIRTLDKRRLEDYQGQVPQNIINQIEKSLKLVLNLS